MSTTTHHEIHPDAEALSAFSEQALGEKERGAVLRHLAACGRCRQVVALARQAADAEADAGGERARRRVEEPRTWWRSWGLALAPAAAIAATAVIGIHVHERSLEKAAEVARLEQQRADEKPPMQAPALPEPQVPAATPGAAPRSAPEKPHKAERAAAGVRTPLGLPEEMTAAPPPVPIDGLFSHREQSENPGSEGRGVNDEAVIPSASAPDGATPAAIIDEERKRQDEQRKLEGEERKREAEEAEGRRAHADKAATPASERGREDGSSGSGAAGSNATVDVQAEQLETEPAPAAGAVQLHGLASIAGFSSRAHGIHLPSGKTAVSIASAGHLMLAIDERGALFLSEDSGETWDKVERQWTGRAIAVRRHSDRSDTGGAVPAPDTAPVDSGAVSHSDTVFELVNDQSQVWISVDGKIWTTK